MRIITNEDFYVDIKRSGHFYPRPMWSGVKDNWFRHENGNGFKHVDCWSYFILTDIYFFFLWWRINLVIKPKLISGDHPMRYVQFHDEYLEDIGVELKNWNE